MTVFAEDEAVFLASGNLTEAAFDQNVEQGAHKLNCSPWLPFRHALLDKDRDFYSAALAHWLPLRPLHGVLDDWVWPHALELAGSELRIPTVPPEYASEVQCGFFARFMGLRIAVRLESPARA